ncbi:MAG: TraB/GumN family protein [Sphingomonadales bacterium]
MFRFPPVRHLAAAAHVLRILVFTALFVVATTARAESQAAPAYWKIERGEATVYLFGAIHLMTPAVPWFTPSLREVFNSSDTLVLEVSPDELAPNAMRDLMARYGVYPNGETLKDHVPAELYSALMAQAAKIGFPEQGLSHMRPWLAGVILAAQAAVQRGFLPEYGVDLALMNAASAMGKSVIGLETADSQFSMFAQLSDAAQARLLEVSLEDLEDIEGLFEDLRDAWLAGDRQALAAPLLDSLAKVPGALEKLLVQRNRRWVPQITALLSGKGTYFVAAGAAHLLGKNSVIKLLEAEGLTVERQ